MSGFHGAFATGVACQQLTLPDTWFRPPLWEMLVLQLLGPDFSNLPCVYSTFLLEYPLVLSRFCFGIQASEEELDLLYTKQKQKYRGMFETEKSRNKTSSGDIGLNIRTLASPEVGQDQVSGGVSVLCWHASPVANVPWKPLAIR